jgi:hypothetical protein
VAISIRSVTVATGTAATISVITSESPAATQIGDLVVFFHGNDFYTAATMGTPTATGSPTITQVGNPLADGGANLAHIRAYWYVVNTAGAQTIQVTESGSADEDKVLVAYVLAGADTVNPIDDSAGTAAASATSQPAPSVSPTTTDALVIIHNNSGGGNAAASYISPGDVTEQYEHHAGGMSGVGATKQLAASGPTGTFEFTASQSVPWAAVTLAITTGSTDVESVGIGQVGVAGSGSSIKEVEGEAVGELGITSTGVSSRPSSNSADLVLTLADALLDCLCNAAAGNPSPPEHCCYRVGTEPVHDVSIEQQDLCCEGLAYVLLRDVYPSVESFPDNDIIRQATGRCAPPAWAVGFRLGMVRCAPTESDCTLNNEAFTQNVYDMQTINTAVCCFRDYVRSSTTFMGMSLVIERQTQGSTSGGCTERYVNIVAQIPNLDCSCG